MHKEKVIDKMPDWLLDEIFDKHPLNIMLTRALNIAIDAHENQKDKRGFAYILHPLAVMVEVSPDIDAMIVAVLHDVIEDTAVTPTVLRSAGFSEGVIQAILLLTRPAAHTSFRPTYTEYIIKIRNSTGVAAEMAKKVKMADLEDHLKTIHQLPPELQNLEKRYRTAMETLRSGEL